MSPHSYFQGHLTVSDNTIQNKQERNEGKETGSHISSVAVRHKTLNQKLLLSFTGLKWTQSGRTFASPSRRTPWS